MRPSVLYFNRKLTWLYFSITDATSNTKIPDRSERTGGLPGILKYDDSAQFSLLKTHLPKMWVRHPRLQQIHQPLFVFRLLSSMQITIDMIVLIKVLACGWFSYSREAELGVYGFKDTKEIGVPSDSGIQRNFFFMCLTWLPIERLQSPSRSTTSLMANCFQTTITTLCYIYTNITNA